MPLDQEKVTNSPIFGWIDGPESRPIKVDKWTRGLVTVTNRDHQINRGYVFTASASTLVASTGGKYAIFVNTNNEHPEMSMEWDVSTSGIYRVYGPSPRIFNPAEDLGPVNVSVENPLTSGISLCCCPLTTGATEYVRRKIYMGSAGGPGGRETTAGGKTSFIHMVPNFTAMFEITTTSDDCAINFVATWSEQIPYDSPPLIVIP
jgi:hypothetical protein